MAKTSARTNPVSPTRGSFTCELEFKDFGKKRVESVAGALFLFGFKMHPGHRRDTSPFTPRSWFPADHLRSDLVTAYFLVL